MLLAEHLTDPLLRIEAGGERFFLYSSKFESMINPAAVEEYAANQLTLVGGAMFVESPDYHASVEVVTAIQHDESKPLPTVITPETLELVLMPRRPTIHLGGVAVSQVDKVRRRVVVAQSNPVVAEGFLYLDHSRLGWPDLYKAFEAVRRDCGGASRLLKHGWTTKSELSCFTQTANHYRHAKSPKYLLPAKPMTILEARKFARGLLTNWLATRYGA
jgi:hypothetical protein